MHTTTDRGAQVAGTPSTNQAESPGMSRGNIRPSLLSMLEGTDRRSIGRANEVVEEVLRNPGRFAELFKGMMSADPVIRMRAADAVEKITALRPGVLQPFKSDLIRKAAVIDQQEVQWHAAQLFPRLTLTPAERRKVIKILEGYLRSRSSIVKTFSMQALADIALQDTALRPAILRRLKSLTATGTPAMRSRGRKLLEKLGRTGRGRGARSGFARAGR